MRWTSWKTPSRLMLEKPAISAGLMEHLVRFADFTKLFSFIHPALKKSRLVKGQLIPVLALSNTHCPRASSMA